MHLWSLFIVTWKCMLRFILQIWKAYWLQLQFRLKRPYIATQLCTGFAIKNLRQIKIGYFMPFVLQGRNRVSNQLLWKTIHGYNEAVDYCYYLDLPSLFSPKSQEFLVLPGHKIHSCIFQQCSKHKEKTHSHPDVNCFDVGYLKAKETERKYNHSHVICSWGMTAVRMITAIKTDLHNFTLVTMITILSYMFGHCPMGSIDIDWESGTFECSRTGCLKIPTSEYLCCIPAFGPIFLLLG